MNAGVWFLVVWGFLIVVFLGLGNLAARRREQREMFRIERAVQDEMRAARNGRPLASGVVTNHGRRLDDEAAA